ncbi:MULTISPECIES: ABC transporter ATP-binding protein [Methanosarcina]|uniref:ABC transporter n=3 Tax=Methanosarcina barkeri TaxID=2208 RepID=A0A0E3QQV4_METBA|nr:MULTISPECIES: ABC transporter ATP-binding protein [Methanosarcina]AKB53545.1 ABC transporter [Methanosarcina barkeri MS]AKB58347.1 ABC transporter [Methanosarcina barkeri 227]AKJ39135.1 polysaccharide/polyol phosphate ABC transporter ATP-binding protein [Methanosarcina barkeri CM1]OED02475.1 ABC transporter [Methanosarcina sp. A14]
MIKVSGVSKKFKLYHTPTDRLKEKILKKKYHREITALDNISFEVKEGQTLGVVGQNGAGKSTLLKVLSGVMLPDEGLIEVDGKITGLLELGTGFDQELTGIENIFMNGTFLGMDKSEIEKKKDEIIDFTELGDFIYDPIKTYSSGMLMRLAFSIAMHAEPKCFLVDEALSVGDAYFQQKCMRKILEFKNSGGSIIFVSHDMNAVKIVCDSAMLLDHGHMLSSGDPKDIIDYYHGMILQKAHMGDTEVKVYDIADTKDCTGRKNPNASTGEVELISFKILNSKNEEILYTESEQVIKVIYQVKALKELSDPHFGLHVRNNLGVSVFETNTYCSGIKTFTLKKGQIAELIWEFFIPLSAGDYSFSVGVANKGYGKDAFEEYLLMAHDIEVLKVIPNDSAIIYTGVFNMKPKIKIQKGSGKEL